MRMTVLKHNITFRKMNMSSILSKYGRRSHIQTLMHMPHVNGSIIDGTMGMMRHKALNKAFLTNLSHKNNSLGFISLGLTATKKFIILFLYPNGYVYSGRQEVHNNDE